MPHPLPPEAPDSHSSVTARRGGAHSPSAPQSFSITSAGLFLALSSFACGLCPSWSVACSRPRTTPVPFTAQSPVSAVWQAPQSHLCLSEPPSFVKSACRTCPVCRVSEERGAERPLHPGKCRQLPLSLPSTHGALRAPDRLHMAVLSLTFLSCLHSCAELGSETPGAAGERERETETVTTGRGQGELEQDDFSPVGFPAIDLSQL